MTTTVTYKPNKSVSFGDLELLWGIDRQEVREMLNHKFEIADEIIYLSQYNNGDISKNIIQRRDIYENYNGQENFFFLNFDIEDKLQEIEIHYGLEININKQNFNFKMDIDKVAELLQNISGDKTQLSNGEYFFKSLKLTIASGEEMGGEGNVLSYFYCSKDITHLLNNEVFG